MEADFWSMCSPTFPLRVFGALRGASPTLRGESYGDTSLIAEESARRLPPFFYYTRLMAAKATIHKAQIELADLDQQIYWDEAVTLARHPSETDERMLVRLLAFALNKPAENDEGFLEFSKDMWDVDEPALWQKDFTGQTVHWIEIGQPDDKRIMRASSRSGRVSVYSFSASTSTWWEGIHTKVTRARNLTVWQVPADQSQGLAALAQRAMKLQVTIQEGTIWVGDGAHSVEITLQRLSLVH